MINKKGITWEQLVLAIIAVVVVLLVILWFKSTGEEGFGFVKNKISDLGKDFDGDGMPDSSETPSCVGSTENSQKNMAVDINGCPLENTPAATTPSTTP